MLVYQYLVKLLSGIACRKVKFIYLTGELGEIDRLKPLNELVRQIMLGDELRSDNQGKRLAGNLAPVNLAILMPGNLLLELMGGS